MNKANKIYIDRANLFRKIWYNSRFSEKPAHFKGCVKDLNKLYRQLLKSKEIRLNYMQGLDELIKRLDS